MIDDISRGIIDKIDSAAGATLRGYIGTRYYSKTVPQGTTFPFVTISCISDLNANTFTEEVDWTHWQFDIWDDNLDTMQSGHIKDITKAIRALFDYCELVVGDPTITMTEIPRTYDDLDLLTYNEMDLMTYDELDFKTVPVSGKEYYNFGTVYKSQMDIPQDNGILHRAMEYEIWIAKN